MVKRAWEFQPTTAVVQQGLPAYQTRITFVAAATGTMSVAAYAVCLHVLLVIREQQRKKLSAHVGTARVARTDLDQR